VRQAHISIAESLHCDSCTRLRLHDPEGHSVSTAQADFQC
jgi:hypothetical protein